MKFIIVLFAFIAVATCKPTFGDLFGGGGGGGGGKSGGGKLKE